MYVDCNRVRPIVKGIRVDKDEKDFIDKLTKELDYRNNTDMILEALKLLKQSKQQQNYENR